MTNSSACRSSTRAAAWRSHALKSGAISVAAFQTTQVPRDDVVDI
jgi:hypothetical protein